MPLGRLFHPLKIQAVNYLWQINFHFSSKINFKRRAHLREYIKSFSIWWSVELTGWLGLLLLQQRLTACNSVSVHRKSSQDMGKWYKPPGRGLMNSQSQKGPAGAIKIGLTLGEKEKTLHFHSHDGKLNLLQRIIPAKGSRPTSTQPLPLLTTGFLWPL